MAEITLTKAIFGMGNQNHAHVHRHNILDMSTMNIDTLKMEQHQGGVTANTLNAIAAQSGGLTTRPSGIVNIEDDWNIRRGLGMLNFMITNNSVEQAELSVLGYLTGGGATHEGIEPQTMFVPVRCWDTRTTQKFDNMGLPMPSTVITGSHQFLMGDPTGRDDLKSVRPLDMAQEVLGYMASANDGMNDGFDGILAADLKQNVVMSKTDNLNPTHHARELLRVAAATTTEGQYTGIANAIGDAMVGPGIGEAPLTSNDFFKTMMSVNGSFSMANFMGWSMAEINSVFTNLPDVMNIQLLNPTATVAVDNTLTSTEYGGANSYETIASELAYLTVHMLIRCGLTHLVFSATNNPHHFSGLEGSETGVEIVTGTFGSVLDHDEYAINRVERFKEMLRQLFFSKYSTQFAHTSTILSVQVSCHLFGETDVTVFFNGEEHNERKYVNATYAVNRTSTNITNSQDGLNAAHNFMQNITDYFTK